MTIDEPGIDPADDEEVERFELLGMVVERRGADIYIQHDGVTDINTLKEHFIATGEAAEEQVRSGTEELKELLSSVQPLHLIGQVALWATMGVPDVDDAAERFGREAQVEYLCGLALGKELPHSHELAGPQEVATAMQLLEQVFEAERLRIFGEEVQGNETGPYYQARFILRHEDLLDRTQGFVPHLGATLRAVFEPIRPLCEAILGFCPADLPDFVSAIVRLREADFQRRLEAAYTVEDGDLGLAPEERPFALMSWVMFTVVDPSGDLDPQRVAEEAGVELGKVSAMFEVFTAEWESQPGFSSPRDPNLSRRYPVLRGEPGRYSVPLVWSLIHETIPWFKDFVESNGLIELRDAYFEARGPAVEGLALETIASVFGPDRVFSNLEYPIGPGNWAEVDGLVVLDGHAFIIEAKSNALHDAYRRGDAERIGFHAEDLLRTPMRQSARAAEYVLGGGTRFRSRADGSFVEITPKSSVTRIIVSLERIDPLVLIASDLTGEAETVTPAWVVSIPDLLAICEILDSPHALAPYVLLRSRLERENVKVITETDYLGAFLNDRLRRFSYEVERADARQMNALTQHSQDLNAYYSGITAGLEIDKPGIDLDDNELALDAIYAEQSPAWLAAACEVVLGENHPVGVI